MSKFGLILDWLLVNFDFENGRIMLNANEDIEVTREMVAKNAKSSRDTREANLLRTYYFSDDEVGLLYRLKFL